MSKEHGGDIRRIGPESEPQGIPLMQALRRTVVEYSKLPKGRRPDVFPEDTFPDINTYFRSEDTLVLLRLRRPMDNGLGKPSVTVREGIFAEVFDMVDNSPINGFSRTNYRDGLFKKIEVTDEKDDPYYGSLYLTPTVFNRTIGNMLDEKMSNQPKALSSSGGEELGTLGQLLASRKSVDIEQEKNQKERRSIYKEIAEEFFNTESFQGLDEGVGSSHFVITENPDSQLVQISKKLGLETHTVKMDETWAHAGKINPIDRLRDTSNKRPMIVSLDVSSFGDKEKYDLRYPADAAQAQVINYAKDIDVLNNPSGNPLFSFIEWRGDNSPRAARLQEGRYLLEGNDTKMAEKLITKVFIDYLLTSEVRDLAKKLG